MHGRWTPDSLAAGYIGRDAAVANRYHGIAGGCIRMHAALHPEDPFNIPEFRAVKREFAVDDHVLIGNKRVFLYRETFDHLGLSPETIAPRLVGWRCFFPEMPPLSHTVGNVDLIIDFEANRETSSRIDSERGGFICNALFSVTNPANLKPHSEKFMLNYFPGNSDQAPHYKKFSFSVAHENNSQLLDKIDIITSSETRTFKSNSGALYRVQIGRADLAPKQPGKQTALRCQWGAHVQGNIFSKRENIVSIESDDGTEMIDKRPSVRTDEPFGGFAEAYYNPRKQKGLAATPFFNEPATAFFDEAENTFGIRSGSTSWQLPFDFLQQIPLPNQDFQFTGEKDQIVDLMQQLYPIFTNLIYERMTIESHRMILRT